MEITILNELIPLLKVILIGLSSTMIINSIKNLLKSMDNGEYSFKITFIKVDKQL